MIFLISDHIEVTCAGEAEDDVLGFAGLFALESFVDSYADRVGALRSGKDAFNAGEHLSCFKDFGLLDGNSFHQAVVIELGEHGAHAVVAKAAGMVGSGDEVASQRVHLGQRAHHTGVAEVISVDAACETRAGSRLNCDDLIVRFAAELLAHEGSDEAAEVGTAAGAADDHVGLDAILVEGRLGLKTDDGLVQKDLIEDGSEHIAVAGIGNCDFHCFGDRAAEGSGCAGVLSEDLAADICRIGRRRCDGSAVGAHHFAAERLLLITDFDHVYLAVEVKIGTGFLIGCSFSFESEMIEAGIEMRHNTMGRNVPMYITGIDTVPAGVFSGKMVVSMRPVPPQQVVKAVTVTAQLPKVHGSPIHIGDPSVIGIKDIDHPEFGDPVEIKEGEVTMFWPCGVTPQSVVMNVKPDFAITHAPGHMLILDVKNVDLKE